jgi:hypothetical protein
MVLILDLGFNNFQMCPQQWGGSTPHFLALHLFSKYGLHLVRKAASQLPVGATCKNLLNARAQHQQF